MNFPQQRDGTDGGLPGYSRQDTGRRNACLASPLCEFIRGMPALPSLRTERLVLRQFLRSDAKDIRRLGGTKESRQVGMPYEGQMREQDVRFGRFVQVELYGIL
ncbi:MAG: hypothetical protein ACM34B_14855 [Nitrospira sp.]